MNKHMMLHARIQNVRREFLSHTLRIESRSSQNSCVSSFTHQHTSVLKAFVYMKLDRSVLMKNVSSIDVKEN